MDGSEVSLSVPTIQVKALDMESVAGDWRWRRHCVLRVGEARTVANFEANHGIDQLGTEAPRIRSQQTLFFRTQAAKDKTRLAATGG
jgi:hypothetical protein